MIRFLLIILAIYAVWQIVKVVLRLMLMNWIRKNAGQGNQTFGPFGWGNYGTEQRPEGEIRIDKNFRNSRDKKSGNNEGEYVDFEEIN
jgi:hypothetical protein